MSRHPHQCLWRHLVALELRQEEKAVTSGHSAQRIWLMHVSAPRLQNRSQRWIRMTNVDETRRTPFFLSARTGHRDSPVNDGVGGYAHRRLLHAHRSLSKLSNYASVILSPPAHGMPPSFKKPGLMVLFMLSSCHIKQTSIESRLHPPYCRVDEPMPPQPPETPAHCRWPAAPQSPMAVTIGPRDSSRAPQPAAIAQRRHNRTIRSPPGRPRPCARAAAWRMRRGAVHGG